MKTVLIIFTSLFIGLALGWLAGSRGQEISSKDDSTLPNPSSSSPSQITQGAHPQNPADPHLISAPHTSPKVSKDKLAAIDSLKNDLSLKSTAKALQILNKMSEAEISQALSEIQEDQLTTFGDFLTTYYLIAAWVDKNPVNAHAFLQSNEDSMYKELFTNSLFGAWGARDPEGALAAVDAITDPGERADAMSAALGQLMTKDPQRTFEILRAGPESENVSSYRDIFYHWTNQNPTQAWAAIETIQKESIRFRAIAGYFNSLVKSHPTEAAAKSFQLTRAEEQIEAANEIFQHWIKEDFDAAIAYLESLPKGQVFNGTLSPSIHALSQSDPVKALAWAQEKTKGRLHDSIVAEVVRQIASKSPEEAATIVEQLPFGRAYKSSIKSLAGKWAREDPQSALAWISTLPDGEEKSQALNRASSTFARFHTEDAKRYVSEMEAGDSRVHLVERLTTILVNKDPQDTLNWINTLNDESLKQTAYTETLANWARANPITLLKHLKENNEEARLPTLSARMAKSWAVIDPSAAADWVNSLEAGEARINAIGGLSREWLQHDPYEASLWISQLPEGAERDRGAGNLVNETYRSDPSTALDWATGISNSKQRNRMIEKVVKHWAQKNESAAVEALKLSDLPPAEITLILDKIEKK